MIPELDRLRARSCPRRQTLAWRSDRFHLLVADAAGQPRMTALLAAAPDGARYRLLPDGAGLEQALSGAPIGTLLLAAGHEGFLQALHPLLWRAGLSQDVLQAECVGSTARDVLCIHCQAVSRAERVIHACSCGQILLVRDHFSVRMGLYQGMPLDRDDPLIPVLSGVECGS